ncbi:MAG TPA: hypothetical protein VGO34_11550 [Alphaproteobacteria bacterium]|jgi:hypothetical protein
MHRSSAIALAGFALLLAACAPGNPRTLANQFVTYTYADYAAVTSNRDARVVMRGNPFAMTQADFDEWVTYNMEHRGGNMGTNFTTGPTTNADPNFEVVWIFNGPTTVQADELCINPGGFPTRSGPATQLNVLVAFCRFHRAASWVEGWLDGSPQGVPREGFEKLIQQMTRELFPAVARDDPRRDSGRCGGPFC